MKNFELTGNHFNVKQIPESFLLKKEYVGLTKNTHVCLKQANGNLFFITKINGKDNCADNTEFLYGFTSIQLSDFVEMSLDQYLKLKAFL